jgi:tRNA(Ile2)-agmatinylcytidine synthase
MRCFIGLDDTDSSRGYCTTYLGFRIASDLKSVLTVLPYPRLVRLNPNIPFKTRGNAAVCLEVETPDPDQAFDLANAKLKELSDVSGGANSGLVFLQNTRLLPDFEPIYRDALSRIVSPARVRRFLAEEGVRYAILGNGMGLVGAAASLGFTSRDDHTFELISYRRRESWGSRRVVDPSSVEEMDSLTFPHTFNNYDYQKRKVLITPHGPDPVFFGVRGDSPAIVTKAFTLLRFEEKLEGYMVYMSNQHTDAHLNRRLDWKVFSSGWVSGSVETVEIGPGGHVYLTIREGGRRRHCAFYEPTGDLRRVAKRLAKGDKIRLAGGVRRATSVHAKVLNVERMQVLTLARPQWKRTLVRGTYIASPRANRHLTKPLIRYGMETSGSAAPEIRWWLMGPVISARAPAGSR